MSEEEKKFAIVMRMAGIRPENLVGYECHRQRRGGDIGHVDETRSHMNRRLIGPENWAELALGEIEEMRLENFANELGGLKRRRRKSELERRFAHKERIAVHQAQTARQREIKLASKEAAVAVRAGEADTKHRTAEAMISVAKDVAAGKIEVTEKPDPADKASNDPVRIARHQAAILFGRALQALRLKTRDKLEAEFSEARGEIRAADDVIVDIARRLPTPLRTQIAEARKSLTLRIMALGQTAKRQFRNRDHEHPEK